MFVKDLWQLLLIKHFYEPGPKFDILKNTMYMMIMKVF